MDNSHFACRIQPGADRVVGFRSTGSNDLTVCTVCTAAYREDPVGFTFVILTRAAWPRHADNFLIRWHARPRVLHPAI